MKNQPEVLVIDDEQIICDSCQRILSNENFKVDTDTDAKGGYEKALANNYDLILLDLNMREMDGIQLLTKLRKDKPDVPVFIITGYPTKETKEESRNLGVLSYILKPFKPNEILDPAKSIIYQSGSGFIKNKDEVETAKQEKASEWQPAENNYWFYKNGWVQKGSRSLVKVGGQYPDLFNEPVQSMKLATAGEPIYRGFPIAELSFKNDIKVMIPSPVSGKIIEINTKLINNPSLFEEDDSRDNWIATIMPDNLGEDLKMCETRNLVLLSNNEKESTKYFNQLTSLGYTANNAGTIEDAIKTMSDEEEKVIVCDAKTFGEQGPLHIEALKAKMPEAKIIVFNVTDTNLEHLYREKKIFYYAVDPISRKEISSILFGAFCFTKDRETTESNKTTFLPPTVNRIQITNKFSKKVALLAYDNVLQFNKGTGYLLIQKLHDNLYPIEIDHTKDVIRMKDSSSSQKISLEKMKNDKIIVLYKEDMNKITGSIVKLTETYENSNGQDNQLIKIAIQPLRMDNNELVLDMYTTKALTEIIEYEMTIK